VVLIRVAGSGGAGLELPLRLGLPLGVGEIALDPELVPLLGDQLGDGGMSAGTWKALRNAWEKAASCGGSRPRMPA
jgi:hypothetical protein